MVDQELDLRLLVYILYGLVAAPLSVAKKDNNAVNRHSTSDKEQVNMHSNMPASSTDRKI